jgi:hypothetical protein
MSWRISRNTNDTAHVKKHEANKRTPWPRLIKIGRTTVKIYRRKMPSGNWSYRIPNYSSGKRRFDCHPDEVEAIEAATRLARKLSALARRRVHWWVWNRSNRGHIGRRRPD